MNKTINSKILIRRDTTANWSTNNPILAAGQIGFDITVGKHKIGDGIHHWNDLSYFALVSDLNYNTVYVESIEPANASEGDVWFIIEN